MTIPFKKFDYSKISYEVIITSTWMGTFYDICHHMYAIFVTNYKTNFCVFFHTLTKETSQRIRRIGGIFLPIISSNMSKNKGYFFRYSWFHHLFFS